MIKIIIYIYIYYVYIKYSTDENNIFSHDQLLEIPPREFSKRKVPQK